MIELYTEEEYINKAREANRLNQKLYIYTYTQEVEEEQPVFETDGEVLKPVMLEIEEKVPTYDENGEQTGVTTIINEVQKTEMTTVQKEYGELVIAPDGYYVCYRDNLTDGTKTADYEENQLARAKDLKNAENTAKAKQTIENGFVVYKNAEFETNAQTVGDLTATMLMLQQQQGKSVQWLSKDDKVVELSALDIGTLGGLIAEFKSDVWNEKYLFFKMLISQAETVEDVMGIQIDYAEETEH